MQPAVTRYVNGEIRAYYTHSSPMTVGSLKPAATYSINPYTTDNSRWLTHAVSASLDRAVYLNRYSAICINQTGHPLWRHDFEPSPESNSVAGGGCAFSRDGSHLWVYRPDAMNDCGPDLLVVLDASSGAEIAREELDSVGQGAIITVHPDGRNILFDVGEGQDGVKMYRAVLAGDNDKIELHSYGWEDRCLLDMAPDGRTFMTVDHNVGDAAFHAFPGGDVLLRVSVEDFGYEGDEDDEDDEACIHYIGGFLDLNTAVVTVKGETEDEEWVHYHAVDVRTGAHLGRLDAHPHNDEAEGFQPLGDGTWVESDDGNVVRHRFVAAI
ncbi:hypothetical protein ASPVEDRAFT_41457 [Aspergillus versicolor CBS 583.65]|uniref:Dipeptidylpeptidase IV N-terminal domain-containing protein n=1 Tax=Aspergillus versicolor CBS 583.65 TaxID=1036611 RepID=A0A1L9PK84_ASPVE|nr:uncharacterized protein ASPVEDRAFT_41457 [Aspergillus versicolor CBS 583.65]OJJ01901.1 hypothetical protein ASPVEDRAFT_41457 [Aspergillus versicolor CBS 583.65]